MYKWVSVLMVMCFSLACNVSRVVKPLKKGENLVSASLGGPAILLSGTPMPIPFSSVAYARGLDTNLSVFTGFHTTSLMFGVAHVDVGMTISAFETKSKKFGVSVSPAMHLFSNFEEGAFRNYPQIDINAWYNYGKKPHFLYGGAGTWLELYRERAHGEEQKRELMPYATLGHQWVREKWNFQLELRYIGFPYHNDKLVVQYLTPLSTGTTGVYFGVSRNIGKR